MNFKPLYQFCDKYDIPLSEATSITNLTLIVNNRVMSNLSDMHGLIPTHSKLNAMKDFISAFNTAIKVATCTNIYQRSHN